MTAENPDTWSWRDLPVLRAAVAGVDANPVIGIYLSGVMEATGLCEDDVYRSAKALESAGLVALQEVFGPPSATRINQVAGAARVHAGQWPSEETALDRILSALEAIAANSDDTDTRSRARQVLDGMTAAGKTIGLAVATAAITGQIPGPN